MGKLYQLIILIILLLSACKVTNKRLPGVYSYQYADKTTIKLYPDKSFEFERNNINPYLHPADHPDEYFFKTKGNWQLTNGQLTLTSVRDSIVYPLVTVEKKIATDSSTSNFTFYDEWKDSVKILYVQYSDSALVMKMHSTMPFFNEDLRKADTLQFHFYGYPNYTFISNHKQNSNFNITLYPIFKPGVFTGTIFTVKHNKLIQMKDKKKFKFIKRHS